jgi:two-component system response regulator MprA
VTSQADRPARILVLDDEPAVRALLVRVLQEEGHQVVAFEDGRAGLDAAAGGPYDLLITNNHAPHLTGDQVLERLTRRFPGLPILHLDTLSHAAEPATSRGPMLFQPFSIDALLLEVQRLVRQRAAG